MRRFAPLTALLAVLTLVAAACGGGNGGGGGNDQAADLSGQTIEVAAVWVQPEQGRFQEVLDAFEERTGATVNFTSTGDDISAVLGPRIEGGNPPDVAILPQPALLEDYANRNVLQPIEEAAGDEVNENYAPVWRELGSVNDTLYGVWFKAANKSLMWYRTDSFQAAGVEPPGTWDELKQAAQTLSDSGVRPFSVGGADGWTLTDWFENVYLQVAGGEKYDQLTEHEIPWTDESVKTALQRLAEIWGNDQWLAGGQRGALQTNFNDSVTQVFTDPPRAAIVYEGDFVANVIEGDTEKQVGEDADSFVFPTIGEAEGAGAVVGGGDVAVLMRDSEGGRALIEYLATPEAAEIWARLGGFTSPNRNVDLSVYPNDILRRSAEALTTAEEFRFDMSDLAPPSFGSTTGAGMWKLFQDFLRNPSNVDAIAQQLESAAARAYRS